MASEEAEQELVERLEREGAKSSEVQVSLMWDNYNDLDLHVLCPSGERIHGGNKVSECGGELDVDANVRPETKKPVENIVWPDFQAPPGEYKVYVHHYKKHKKRRSKDPTKYRVVVNAGGELKHYEVNFLLATLYSWSVNSTWKHLKKEAQTKSWTSSNCSRN